jgi:hypothetical protein
MRLKALAQEASVALIDLVEARGGRSGIGEGFRRDACGLRTSVQGARAQQPLATT